MPTDEFTDAPDTGSTETAPSASIDQDLAATWNRLHADEPIGTGPEQAPSAPSYDGPQSWSAPMRQRLSALPPEYSDVRDYIAQREREAQTEISRHGQERAQIRALAAQAGLPENMPLPEMMQHLQHAYGPGPAADKMRQMAETYQRDYEPIKGVLDQYRDVFEHYGIPPHQAISQLLQIERALRNSPEALGQLAQAYGHTLPLPAEAQQQMTTLQQQLAEASYRENRREVETFRQGKEYFNDAFMTELAVEMRQLQKETPGLKGTALLKLAHDNLTERTGITSGSQADCRGALMPGGKRPGAGRKPGKAHHGPRGPRSKSYTRLMAFAEQQWRLNTTETKREACKIYATLLQHDEPKLQAIMAQTETRITYVARLPAPVESIEEWQKTVTPLLTDKT